MHALIPDHASDVRGGCGRASGGDPTRARTDRCDRLQFAGLVLDRIHHRTHHAATQAGGRLLVAQQAGIGRDLGLQLTDLLLHGGRRGVKALRIVSSLECIQKPQGIQRGLRDQFLAAQQFRRVH